MTIIISSLPDRRTFHLHDKEKSNKVQYSREINIKNNDNKILKTTQSKAKLQIQVITLTIKII